MLKGPGRPSLVVSEERIRDLLRMKFTKTEIAQSLGISRSTLYNQLSRMESSLPDRYTETETDELDRVVRDIKRAHPGIYCVYFATLTFYF